MERLERRTELLLVLLDPELDHLRSVANVAEMTKECMGMSKGEQVECYIRAIEGSPEPVSLMIECDPLEILPDGFFTLPLRPGTPLSVADRLAKDLREYVASFGYTDMSGVPKAPGV